MLVCHCRVVSDRQVDAVLAAGASHVREVVRATRAGSDCGGCLPSLRARIEQALAPTRAPAALAG